MNAIDVALVGAIAYEFPALRPAFKDHLETYAEILPHVFMAEVCRWAVRTAAIDQFDRELVALLGFLENALVRDGDSVEELIATSFLENLPGAADADAAIRAVLGDGLTMRLSRMEAAP
jgi:hypothetical protein